MIKQKFDLTGLKPFSRESAAEIAIAASRFESILTMESGNSIINMKSMLGLLSHAVPMKGEVTLVADGADETQVMEVILSLMEKYRA
ncbi:MAG: HPr family phosphocarrier protein [Clostridiales bacterium]|nr:HPr family phosphocarrier protein [Clostridiales bacterium]